MYGTRGYSITRVVSIDSAIEPIGKGISKSDLDMLKNVLGTACALKQAIEEVQKGKKSIVNTLTTEVLPVVSSQVFITAILVAVVMSFALGFFINDLVRVARRRLKRE